MSAVFDATSSFLVLGSASVAALLFSLSLLESAASRLAIVLVRVLSFPVTLAKISLSS